MSETKLDPYWDLSNVQRSVIKNHETVTIKLQVGNG